MTLGRALRLLRHVMGLLALAAAIGYTVALVMVLIVSQEDERRPAEAIIVLGAAQYNGRPSRCCAPAWTTRWACTAKASRLSSW